MDNPTGQRRVPTGVPNATSVLHGGLLPESATLVRGTPGAGKTIFGLYFLAAADKPVVYINLGEPADYLEATAAGFGLDVDHVEFLDLSPSGEQFQGNQSYDLFEPDEVETTSLVDRIRETVEQHQPTRVLVDPVTELRHLARDDRQFRTQVLSLLDFLKSHGATVMLTSQAADSVPDDDLQFLADAVISLSADSDHRTLSVPKFRGSAVRRGPHTVTISADGMRVWPRLDPTDHYREGSVSTLSSGVDELDSLLGGGLTTGTVSFLSGPTGVGKTTTGLQFITEAAANGQRSVLYSFEESRRTVLTRAEALGMPLGEQVDAGTVVIREIGTDELTLDEFTHRVRSAVEDDAAEIVMIDGVTGYERAFSEAGADPSHRLVKIGQYLRNMNVTGIITNEVHRITGDFRATEHRISHLADDIVFFRHVEHRGELRKVIGVLKKRTSDFESTLRALEITDKGLVVGEPLAELRGILTGTPDWNDD
ncbi:ATPase domain-containing protein [Halohasta salina]|uniref:ATPase domain-containing protein n=1 Tax=Halohasta salina TaxID=2961621 RepID=UPI0020A5606C|nr:ATPase domain-containing protein [Halohasta salina]